MNAYELAKALDTDWADKFRFDAATMLRQQADRIAELEKNANTTQIANEKKFWQNYEKVCCEEVSSKPAAWMYIHKKFKMNDVLLNQREFDSDVIEEIPLYTHPVKQLTPERISDIADETYAHYGLTPPSDLKLMVMGHFARAIIKEITE